MIRSEYFSQMQEFVRMDSRTSNLAKKGLCTFWSINALEVLREFAQSRTETVVFEARNVFVHQCISHTFVRVHLQEDKVFTPYILDGTGVGEYDPYFGPEEESPQHLKNSVSDMINVYSK